MFVGYGLNEYSPVAIICLVWFLSGLATLLCYLELRADRIIQNMPPVYATCKLQCYGGPLQLEAVAKKVSQSPH